ncbi:MAG: hypothetical protein GX333_05855 [Syntrophomonadaceae bacterium]|nr:hypothetical protein [Syntrophomonadaceae bacterium]
MRIASRILVIHFFAILAVWLSTYIVGLDIFMSLLYIVVISIEIYSLKNENKKIKWLSGILWLAIPLLLSILTIFKLYSLGIFLLVFWFTPIIPLISLKTYFFANYPLYYYILVGLPFILILYFYLLANLLKKDN